ncbi:MAG TPA: hypothetical protein VK195_08585 [Burkholderiaceae bacterium]|nr:hypothetical protein [Burkholderiaceae bacterium]
MTSSFRALLAGLCALLAAAVMWPGRGGDFIFDDLPNIVDNTRLHLVSLAPEGLKRAAFSYEPGGGSRPLAMLSFALDHWRAGGLDAAAFKGTNLLIHALTVLVLAALMRRVLAAARWPEARADVVALGLALAWGVHPLQVSSVLYVVQRMQTLGTLFIVSGLWSYMAARQSQQAGRRSLPYWLLLALSLALGLASKEDTVLLPLFTLVLELTVLRFQGVGGQPSQAWRRGYAAFVGLGAVAYLFVIAPHYWHTDAYPGRTFSSAERLLTQARVLMMYLGQSVLPLPARLPFYYDDLAASRGWLEPATTLLSVLALAALAVWAWIWRRRRPVFATGVLWFLAGHFLTSNVLNLELAFEHRQQWPLVGVLMALADLGCLALDRLKASRGIPALVGLLLVATLCGLTWLRASTWGDPFLFAMQGPQWAPESSRAWHLLCKTYYNRSGGDPGHPLYGLAMNSCQHAADRPGALAPLADLITLKAMQEDQDASADWRLLQDRLRNEPISPEGRDVLNTLLANAGKDVPLDTTQLASTIEVFAARVPQTTVELANMAHYLLTRAAQPERAYAFYLKAIRTARPGDPLVERILRDLADEGMEEWAQRLRKEGPV